MLILTIKDDKAYIHSYNDNKILLLFTNATEDDRFISNKPYKKLEAR